MYRQRICIRIMINLLRTIIWHCKLHLVAILGLLIIARELHHQRSKFSAYVLIEQVLKIPSVT